MDFSLKLNSNSIEYIKKTEKVMREIKNNQYFNQFVNNSEELDELPLEKLVGLLEITDSFVLNFFAFAVRIESLKPRIMGILELENTSFEAYSYPLRYGAFGDATSDGNKKSRQSMRVGIGGNLLYVLSIMKAIIDVLSFFGIETIDDVSLDLNVEYEYEDNMSFMNSESQEIYMDKKKEEYKIEANEVSNEINIHIENIYIDGKNIEDYLNDLDR